jgi:alginate O-acetyltransferase complex protein AlgJ
METGGSTDNDPGNALFGDQSFPVALVGTSYSANPQWNFEGFLKEALQTDILNAADEGRGPFETMKDYLEDDSFATNPPDLIVWEIPERYLSVSYELAMKKS